MEIFFDLWGEKPEAYLEKIIYIFILIFICPPYFFSCSLLSFNFFNFILSQAYIFL